MAALDRFHITVVVHLYRGEVHSKTHQERHIEMATLVIFQ